MSDDLFNFLDEQHKQTGIAYWGCRSCTAYAKGMNHRMQEIENKIEEVKQSYTRNDGEIRKVESEVKKLAEKVERQGKMIEKAAETVDGNIYEELREREAKRLNVVMYGMGEAAEEATGRERWDWDIKSCENLFHALKIDIPVDNIRFCRRVGERTTTARPLVVGFYEERDRLRLLRCDTRKTVFADVEVCPDLTKKQRQEETELAKEAVKRNMQMNEDDRAKNLVWAVVGRKGEKRLVKAYADREAERLRAGRGRGEVRRPGIVPIRGRGRVGPGGRTRGGATAAGSGAEASWREEEEEAQVRGTRTRLNSKRTRPAEGDDEDMDEMPAAKH
jgi:hypothetical protein